MIIKIRERFQGLSTEKAITLQELAIGMILVVIFATVAVIGISRLPQRASFVSEEALVRSLVKAAIAYNTSHDRWYGMTNAEDIFLELLDNRPDYRFETGYFSYAADNRRWRLIGPDNIGAGSWAIACPHNAGLGDGGNLWSFTVDGARISFSFLGH